MLNSKIISNDELGDYLLGTSKVNKVDALLKQQISTWDLAKNNYNDLKSIKKKEFSQDKFKIQLQFNPGRIISSSAKVDSKSIQERKCFLCHDNLPSEQKGLLFREKYLILVNPFPIFEEHFTIPLLEHSKQEIFPNFSDMLEIAKELEGKYTVFYNGPKCGASAPDHMHFQACTINSMPVETDINSMGINKIELSNNEYSKTFGITNYLRNLFLIETTDKDYAVQEFEKIYNLIKQETNPIEEPLMNIVASFNDGWKIFVFPRKAHRPTQFFADGDAKILLSPAAVDFGGLLITPCEEDFQKLTINDIKDIFKQTTIDSKLFQKIIENYK